MRLLITGAWQEAEKYISLIEEQGHSVVFMPQEKEALPCAYSQAEGVICNGLFLYHDIRRFVNLKYIQLTSAGLDRVPQDYIKENHIALYNARGVYSIPMAEHAVAAVLSFFRNTAAFLENQSKHIWQKQRELRELCGSNVCVIGCGSVGTECAKRFSAFGCEVVGVDAQPVHNRAFGMIYSTKDIFSVIAGADVIVLTLPLNEQTQGLVNEAFLSRLKQGCVIVNISRGKIIDTDALLRALSKQTICAALDVFEDEPLSADSPLWDMKNVIVTPHNSFVGDGNGERLSACIIGNLKDL